MITKFFKNRKNDKDLDKFCENLIVAKLGEPFDKKEDISSIHQFTMEELMSSEITYEAAKSFIWITEYLMSIKMGIDIGSNFSFARTDHEPLKERMQLLHELLQALMDVLIAIGRGKISPKKTDVKKAIPKMVQTIGRKNTCEFWASVNYLKNISTGMCEF